MKLKRIISIVLCAAMVLSAFCIPTSAAQAKASYKPAYNPTPPLSSCTA